MAKGKKRPAELPEYGTVMMKGVQYYRTRITDADGKRVAIYGLTREELYDRVEDAQKKIAEVVFHRENPTVEEYCEKWLLMRSGTVRTNTLEGYARMVNRYIVGPIGQMYMDEVTTDDLRLLMVPLSKGSSGMYGQLNMLIKNIFNSAEESKVIKENPSKTICARGGKPAKRREALTDEQTAILLDSIHELPPYVFVMIGLYAGLRREEILGLKWDCVFLDEKTPYDSDPSKATDFMEHLRRSFHYTIDHLGPHKLPLIGRADWNDCLNLNCFSSEPGESFQTTGPSEGPVAESVFIAGMFVKYGKEFEELCERTGHTELAKEAGKAVDEMYQAVLDNGWDGEWFLRAYDAQSEKVGSKECEEGKIFIEPQGFCVMAGIGKEEGIAEKALDSVNELLETKYGIMILQPAYTRYHLELGEITSYPPGYKENAGIFCHNNPWISIAETVLGRGNRAFEVYRKICPSYIEEISDIHRTEPYVYSQMIAGADAPGFGEAKNSWLTGTAAWTFINLSQALLGILPGYDGLIVDPCLPETFGDFKVNRHFRGADYHIEIHKPKGVQKGVRWIEVDGERINGNQIPMVNGRNEYHVIVQMG